MVKMKTRAGILFLLAVAATTFPTAIRQASGADIVDTAVAAGSFKTLATALEAADLVDALKGEGPFTVFAPTDEAFAKVPSDTLEFLLKPENKQQLAAILTYHVVAGDVPASTVVSLKTAQTLNGQRVDISVEGGVVSVDEAKVIETDIECSNGVIHVIDSVILPTQETIPEVAEKAGSFATLLTAAKAAGLAGVLSGEGPFTVFAPTDDAFAKLPEGTVEALLKPENKQKLAAILKYHVVAGRIYSDAALEAGTAKTVQGSSVSISATDKGAFVNKAKLVATDIECSNGVIHVIDSVLLPPEKRVSAAESLEMIEHAVARGSKLYNSGHHSACAKIYMTTARKMVTYGDQMPPLVMSNLKSTLAKAERTHCPTERSWTLRRGLDRVYYAMREIQHD